MDPFSTPVDEADATSSVEERAQLRADDSAEVRDAGGLAESESLLGAVMVAGAVSEADALRTALELDDAPATAVPTATEQTAQDAQLREAVLDAAENEQALEESPADPTAEFEMHDAALSGDRIAQAIEDATVERLALETLADEVDARDTALEARENSVATSVDAATERLLLNQADAEGANAARAAALDAGAAAAAVVARLRDDQAVRQEVDRVMQQRSTTADQTAFVNRSLDMNDRTVERVDRATVEADRVDRSEDELSREQSMAEADDRMTQQAGAAAATQFGAGRPAVRVEARTSAEAADRVRPRVSEADRIRAVIAQQDPYIVGPDTRTPPRG